MLRAKGNWSALADVVTPEVRSRMMASITARNTKPEMMVRRALHARGYRYRLHAKGLPGTPDLVFPARKGVIFVQGCFWHGHDCHLFRLPGTRSEFWQDKIQNNVARDLRVRRQLASTGWRILDIWECALKGKTRIAFEDVISQCTAWLESSIPEMQIRGAQ